MHVFMCSHSISCIIREQGNENSHNRRASLYRREGEREREGEKETRLVIQDRKDVPMRIVIYSASPSLEEIPIATDKNRGYESTTYISQTELSNISVDRQLFLCRGPDSLQTHFSYMFSATPVI